MLLSENNLLTRRILVDIRQAILNAADLIEKSPDRYDFYSNDKPGCGTPGCMLGWIGHFMGVPASRGVLPYTAAVSRALGFEGASAHHEFVSQLLDVCHPLSLHPLIGKHEVSKSLRLYADKYHPAEAKASTDCKLPDWSALAMQPLPIGETAQV